MACERDGISAAMRCDTIEEGKESDQVKQERDKHGSEELQRETGGSEEVRHEEVFGRGA